MATLEDALESGQGIERPFRCPVHDDRSASASVNTIKMVWVCYACGAKGSVDKNKAPTNEMLAQMLEPEKTCRVYPETYLDLTMSEHNYWHTRFPDWLVWWAQIGEDPVTGHNTFPVRTPSGFLAGIGRRVTDEQVALAKRDGTNPSRYRYPPRWSASRVIHDHRAPQGEVLVLVEGAADAISLWEIGIPAAAVYGSALHAPQVEMVLRRKPTLIILGMDNDQAGDNGAEISREALHPYAPDVARVIWPKKDPSECTPAQRKAVIRSVIPGDYCDQWEEAVTQMKDAYLKRSEE